MDLAEFAITADPAGGGTVLINGEDVSARVRDARIDVAPNELPVVMLTLAGNGTVAGKGVVQVNDARTPGVAVAEWLEQIDPADLRTLVAQQCGAMNQDPFAAALAILADMARQDLQ